MVRMLHVNFKGMKPSHVFLCLISMAAWLSCSEPIEEKTNNVQAATDLLSLEGLGEDKYLVTSTQLGNVTASQNGRVVTLTIELNDFTANTSHAIHLHNGSCEDPSTHWNQNSERSFCSEESLGVLWRKSYAGDIGNITTDSQGQGYLSFSTDLWTLNTGLDSDILNKVLVIHERAEDFGPECFILTAHDHDSNTKIACGRIELVD